MNERKKNGNFRRALTYFAAGLAIGYITAPKTGRGARSWLRQKGEHYRSQAKNKATAVRRRADYEQGRFRGVAYRLRQRQGEQAAKYVDDDLITQRVRTRLGEDRSTWQIPRVNVDTANRTVTLRGAVYSFREKQALEKVAAGVVDVQGVVNKVVVLRGAVAGEQ